VKVVIADDEALVRFSIRSMIEELGLPLTVAAEAANGDELERAVETYRPDIAVVDVRMPGPTGLQAIRRARRAGARTRWLILTSHAEFDYASEAIQLGVAGYLLKPAGPEQLRAALVPLIADIERERAEADGQFVRSLVLGLEASDKGAPVTALPACWAVVIRADFGAAVTALERAARQDEVAASLKNLSSPDARLAVWSAGSGIIRLVTTSDDEGFDARRAAVAAAVKLGPEHCRLSGASTGGIASWSQLTAAFARCDAALVFRGVLGTGVFQETADWERRTAALSAPLRNLASLAEAFIAAWDEGSVPGVFELSGRVAAESPSVGWEAAARYLAHRTAMPAPETGMTAADWARRFEAAARSAVPEVRRAADAQTRVVAGVDDYLNGHLVDEVRVPDIAAFLALSPNYLSSLYRKTAGVTISERLTELRLLKARELLSLPGNAVKSVAADVGYRSTRHFARLYRQRFGHYPSGR
jgi:two-component system response regulator YesN